MQSVLITVPEEHKNKVLADLRSGSDPRPAFFLLVALSTLIAAFGLVMNSTAVVIGAMLVAPLMTPILGLALALVRGDAGLLGIALRSEVIGVVISISAGCILGLTLPEYFEPTTEMLSRTQPNLFDLLVAVLAGAAGAYALVDVKLSPILPGVAIATAIVPPLANCGMCIALGAYDGAVGSFVLFFTNFLSILLVAAGVFYAAGMSLELGSLGTRTLFRRLGVALAGLVVISVLLSYELWRMFDFRRVELQVASVLRQSFADMRIFGMDDLAVEQDSGKLLVIVVIQAPEALSPNSVASIEERLTNTTGRPTSLFVRTAIAHDVSARGSVNRQLEETLDGVLAAGEASPALIMLQEGEQLLREYLETKLALRLQHLRLIPSDNYQLFVAELTGARPPLSIEIQELESLMQRHFRLRAKIRLLVQYSPTVLRDTSGRLRLDFNLPRLETEEEAAASVAVVKSTEDWLTDRGFWLQSWSFTILDGAYQFLLEVTGARLFNAADHAALKEIVSGKVDVAFEIYVHSKLDTVVGPGGNQPLEKLLDDFGERNSAAYESEIQRMIREAR
jgi:uncharacterized hydrophobic protein (TIGR00271 family)